MGCLKVDVKEVSGDTRIGLVDLGGLLADIRLIRERISRSLSVFLRCLNNLFVSAIAVNDQSSLYVLEVGGGLTVSLGLVCLVNLDTECYLIVEDGYLITLEDCYIKVQKQ